MIEGQNVSDPPGKNNLRANDNIQKLAIGQGDNYTTSCLLDYPYFKGSYKMLAIDLSKRKAFDADPKAMQQVNFTANLAEQQTMFFHF